MKSTTLIRILSAISVILWFASPLCAAPGAKELRATGSWTELVSAGGDRIMTFTDGKSYTLNVSPTSIQADPSGEWDWLVSAPTASLFLENVPSTPWYSPCAETVELPSGPTEFLIKMRRNRYLQTNATLAYLEFELTARSASFSYHASFAGTAMVTNVPETADTLPYTQTAGLLNCAGLKVGINAPVRLAAAASETPHGSYHHDLITLVVSNSRELDVSLVDLTSVTANCIPPVAIELTRPHGKLRQEVRATFDRDAIQENLTTTSNRSVGILKLRGKLLNGTPLFGGVAIGHGGRRRFHRP